MNNNVFDKALEQATDLTHKWVTERLKMGLTVSEREIGWKFQKLYQELLLNTEIDILNW